MGSPLAAKLCSDSLCRGFLPPDNSYSVSKYSSIGSHRGTYGWIDMHLKISSPSQHMYETSTAVNPETVSAMLPTLGDLMNLLIENSDENILPTTYGSNRRTKLGPS
ncbi:hypothetical protein RND81_06G098400 [Saponaria officinalis]|uniref:Uncharacterized protein n=1 Tax=Saponaria officinalis TaxID=3572 RepID=A0AAW1K8R7_SAPOF